jgi:Na+(H+)/acetate symporter ActP
LKQGLHLTVKQYLWQLLVWYADYMLRSANLGLHPNISMLGIPALLRIVSGIFPVIKFFVGQFSETDRGKLIKSFCDAYRQSKFHMLVIAITGSTTVLYIIKRLTGYSITITRLTDYSITITRLTDYSITITRLTDYSITIKRLVF